jgi:hypothetical protein
LFHGGRPGRGLSGCKSLETSNDNFWLPLCRGCRRVQCVPLSQRHLSVIAGLPKLGVHMAAARSPFWFSTALSSLSGPWLWSWDPGHEPRNALLSLLSPWFHPRPLCTARRVLAPVAPPCRIFPGHRRSSSLPLKFETQGAHGRGEARPEEAEDVYQTRRCFRQARAVECLVSWTSSPSWELPLGGFFLYANRHGRN